VKFERDTQTVLSSMPGQSAQIVSLRDQQFVSRSTQSSREQGTQMVIPSS
jgi:hypothetical protein